VLIRGPKGHEGSNPSASEFKAVMYRHVMARFRTVADCTGRTVLTYPGLGRLVTARQ
jgi:hypothetical protein